ncbi:DUF2442 domain-containing protein [Paraburkholderia caribensis]|uniref:DUF2442 domain-containing protein n=1 Tax=Paraburkholderia caribensis TaxID=75105 RepID=UPI0031DB09E3
MPLWIATDLEHERRNVSSVATAVAFQGMAFVVTLPDGGELWVPLPWFPRLSAASPEQRLKVRISRSGKGLHWDELDEDISIEGLLRAQRN